ncbi:serine hydrolase [Sporosarcina siberiensis]|uniref:Serine hydrolase n=1 Tax=Sporosarcina siberiensis TaxID=1365606 RepID=A0ABW4SDP5_9BACL
MSLKTKIESYINEIDASFGIYIKNIETKEEVNIQGDRLYQMASVVKVPILATLFDLVEKGEIELTKRVKIEESDFVPGSGVFKTMDCGIEPTIKDLATMMIIVSDNLATDKILTIVGGADRVQEKMRSIGLENIHVRHSIWELLSLCAEITPEPYTKELSDQIIKCLEEGGYELGGTVFQESVENNMSSPKDMCLLLEQIASGTFVSEQCSSAIYQILLKQQYQQRIGGKLPRNTTVANKTGSLGSMFNDAGIVDLPENKGAFVITVYSIGNSLEYKGDEPIARISQIAYEHFCGK